MAAAQDGHAANETILSVGRSVPHWVNLHGGTSKLYAGQCLMRTQAEAAVIGDLLELLLPKGPLKMPCAALISWQCVSLFPPRYGALSARVHKLLNMPTWKGQALHTAFCVRLLTDYQGHAAGKTAQ